MEGAVIGERVDRIRLDVLDKRSSINKRMGECVTSENTNIYGKRMRGNPVQSDKDGLFTDEVLCPARDGAFSNVDSFVIRPSGLTQSKTSGYRARPSEFFHICRARPPCSERRQPADNH